MNTALISAAVGLLCSVAGVLFGFAIYRRNIQNDGESDGEMRSDIKYIKKISEDTLLEQRNTNITLQSHAERITRVEENAKQAHKRINELREKIEGKDGTGH